MAYNKNTDMWEGYIYLVTNNINNKKYVGQTIRTIQQRMSEHFNKNKKYAFSQAIQKYGKENFSYVEVKKIIENTRKDLQVKLNELEIYYIQEYDSLCGNNGYNIDKGGSQASYFRKTVYQYDLNENFVEEYESVTQAENITGIKLGDISKCCNHKGTSFTAGGYYWTFKKDSIRKSPTNIIKNKSVVKYDLQGNFIQSFNCINEISKDKKIKNRIRNCCGGSQYNVEGYVYRYENESFDKYAIFPKKHRKTKEVNKYDLNGNYICSYLSKDIASKDTGISINSIGRCCNGLNKKCDNFIFRYKSDSFNKIEPLTTTKKYKNVKIIQYNVFGEKEKEFVDVYELSKEIKESVSELLRCLKGKRFSLHNKIFRFYYDDYNKYPIYIYGILQYDKKGNLLHRWESCTQCASSFGFDAGEISKAISRKTTHQGYIFTKYGEELFIPKVKIKKVFKYTKNMQLLFVYDSIKEANYASGFNSKSSGDFSRFLKSHNNFYKDCYWIIDE